jgi:phosphoribosyl 1,2-cyclic phosphodiesterase
MTLKVLGSSSSGNCYILEDRRGNVLLIEAGVPFMAVKQALNFEVAGIGACVVSHAHRQRPLRTPERIHVNTRLFAHGNI